MRYPITLAAIRDHKPCATGWSKLLASLGYTDGSYDPQRTVTLGDVARSNGAADALWCARCLPNTDAARRTLVRALLPGVKRALAHTSAQRAHDCVATVERWLAGDATRADLKAAEAALASAEAAWAAADAAWVAAEAAEAAAAAEAAWAAAEAAWAAAEAAAEAAGRSAAAWAAEAAERSLQVDDICAVFGAMNAAVAA